MRWFLIFISVVCVPLSLSAQETPEQYAAVLERMADDFVTTAARGLQWKEQVRATHYAPERLLAFSRATFKALEHQGVRPGQREFEPWLANVAGNAWAQTKLQFVASRNNYDQGKVVDCSNPRAFDDRCDYGPIQLHGGQVRRLWLEVFGRRFDPRRDRAALEDPDTIMLLSVAFLFEQSTGRHADQQTSRSPTSCDATLARAGELRKARCGPYLRHAETLVGASIEQVWRGPYCRKEGCARACHCAIIQQATGGVATAPGGSTLTAWWIGVYRVAVTAVLGGDA